MSDISQDFDFSANILRAILWQYESADKLVSLAKSQQAYLDEAQSEFWTNWYRDVFNIDTANDFGLSVWARILDIPLGFETDPDTTKIAFGFSTERRNFQTDSNFGNRSGGFVALTTEQKRMALKLRYMQLTHRPSVPIVNEALSKIFNDGQGTSVFVYDNYDMQFAAYVFNQQPSNQVRILLEKFDLLPRPSTVGVRWVVERRQAWGVGPNRLNFNNGNFGE